MVPTTRKSPIGNWFYKKQNRPLFLLERKIYLVVHVDDCGIAYKDEDALNWLINELKKKRQKKEALMGIWETVISMKKTRSYSHKKD